MGLGYGELARTEAQGLSEGLDIGSKVGGGGEAGQELNPFYFHSRHPIFWRRTCSG